MQRLLFALPLLLAAGTALAQTAGLPPIQAPAAAANPYGLGALWNQGDWVARVTLLILVIMSVASWYVLITKLIAQSRMGGQGRARVPTPCRRTARSASSPSRRWRRAASMTA